MCSGPWRSIAVSCIDYALYTVDQCCCCVVYRLCTVHCKSMLLLLLLLLMSSSSPSPSLPLPLLLLLLLFYFMSFSSFFWGGGWWAINFLSSSTGHWRCCHLPLATEDVVIFYGPLKMLSSSTGHWRCCHLPLATEDVVIFHWQQTSLHCQTWETCQKYLKWRELNYTVPESIFKR